MSRPPLADVRSHAHETPRSLGLVAPESLDPDAPVFRRDCLEARAGPLTLFVVHFKAPYPDADAAWPVRRLEAQATRRIVERRFADPARALWLVLGDLNEPGRWDRDQDRAVAPLAVDFARDLLTRAPKHDRWTYWTPEGERRSRPDALLASPALAARWPNARPRIIRAGLDRAADRGEAPRFPGVGGHRPHASDHAALLVDFEEL